MRQWVVLAAAASMAAVGACRGSGGASGGQLKEDVVDPSAGLVPYASANCPDPTAALDEILQLANSRTQVSEVLAALDPARFTMMSANTSFSAQGSLGYAEAASDPRIYAMGPCVMVTATLLGGSLEVGLVAQRPALRNVKTPGAAPQPCAAGVTPDCNPSIAGEVLVDMRPFPRQAGAVFRRADVVNRWDPVAGKETKSCITCHKDSGKPTSIGTSLGLMPMAGGDERILAVVSPYYKDPHDEDPGEGAYYCMPKDLELMQGCLCGGGGGGAAPECAGLHDDLVLTELARNRDASQVQAALRERCARLDVFVRLAHAVPARDKRYLPTPEGDDEQKACLSERALQPAKPAGGG